MQKPKDPSSCYYCDKYGQYRCDHIDAKTGLCGRKICEDHSVPEFKGYDKWTWTLCLEHKDFQRE